LPGFNFTPLLKRLVLSRKNTLAWWFLFIFQVTKPLTRYLFKIMLLFLHILMYNYIYNLTNIGALKND